MLAPVPTAEVVIALGNLRSSSDACVKLVGLREAGPLSDALEDISRALTGSGAIRIVDPQAPEAPRRELAELCDGAARLVDSSARSRLSDEALRNALERLARDLAIARGVLRSTSSVVRATAPTMPDGGCRAGLNGPQLETAPLRT
jgi:hypothetical protein